MKSGDKISFDRNWQDRAETQYSHWVRGEPQNQIQFAFRNHWTLFSELMKSEHFSGGLRCLEIGCGRGTMSAYFSDAGFDCTLLDISETVIDRAHQMFEDNDLKGQFHVGDACSMPFDDASSDVVVSIGLLEHFEDIEPPLREQIRVLAPGGLLLCYVVPKYEDNLQSSFNWINELLEGYSENSGDTSVSKEEVFRSDEGSGRYVQIMNESGLSGVTARGVYSLPMISHSIDFPFTLMPEQSELALVEHFKGILASRADETGEHPWLCDEGYGQAFLVFGYKCKNG